jgi:cellulose synthase/poly-beta-1,6-N-acetylglucosamine synthase-like glycosyltransferase
LTATTVIFWTAFLLLVYVYAGYPILARLLGWIRSRPVNTSSTDAFLPTVTVVIAAFNESRHIVATVRNKLESDYPADRLDVIVVSDGSDDGTDDLVRGIDDPRVRLLRQEPRAGKTSGLNLGVPEATGEIVVFSDANSIYREDTLRNLVAPLSDPNVGYVTGRMVYRAPDGSLTGEGCSAYMAYENTLRRWETDLGSIVGVDGGVDAMRRSLYRPMRVDQLPDFVQPLTVREQGYRVVYAPGALLYEDALARTEDEFRMRVRVSLRAMHALKDKARMLNPFRFGLFAWQLWSHKVLRYLAFLFQATVLLANLVLAATGNAWWLAVLAAQAVFYAAALLSHASRHRKQPRVVGAIYYLCVVNLAGAFAFFRFLLGHKQVTWTPRT